MSLWLSVRGNTWHLIVSIFDQPACFVWRVFLQERSLDRNYLQYLWEPFKVMQGPRGLLHPLLHVSGWQNNNIEKHKTAVNLPANMQSYHIIHTYSRIAATYSSFRHTHVTVIHYTQPLKGPKKQTQRLTSHSRDVRDDLCLLNTLRPVLQTW